LKSLFELQDMSSQFNVTHRQIMLVSMIINEKCIWADLHLQHWYKDAEQDIKSSCFDWQISLADQCTDKSYTIVWFLLSICDSLAGANFWQTLKILSITSLINSMSYKKKDDSLSFTLKTSHHHTHIHQDISSSQESLCVD